MARFEIIDEHTVVDADGLQLDVREAIAGLPWVDQLCPLMPHQYAHRSKAHPVGYAVVEHMLKAANPDTYRAYFRGYRLPNRYWDAPDGQRYWLTRMMINRCWPDSVEPLRLVTDGAAPAQDWEGPPHAPDGIGIYEQADNGHWRPTGGCHRWRLPGMSGVSPDPIPPRLTGRHSRDSVEANARRSVGSIG